MSVPISKKPKTSPTSYLFLQGNITMLRPFTKTLTATALAITLALTGITATASPAAANGHRNNNGANAAAVFGGLLLLYGLSQADRGGSRGNLSVTHQPRHTPRITHQPRHDPHRFSRVAPSRCFVEGRDRNGHFRGFGHRCMQNHAQNTHLLPRNCLRHVWTDRGQRTIYGGRCLADNGWTRG